ncbi:hypothetical protein BC937DRAFT_87807 [Endogone sp. FLAS-F59071]|nr:hypothetical protein BC937DRAFT_87807 [Endogone sp. FLAS-F59071]|eukprot:RUS19222.1 hypothetical protein BC937DRAFT_87807 [Endogone sp. FLAS-F59071]
MNYISDAELDPLVPDATFAPSEYIWRVSDYNQIHDLYANQEKLDSPTFWSPAPPLSATVKQIPVPASREPFSWTLRLFPNGSRSQSGHASIFLTAIPNKAEQSSHFWSRRDVAFSIEFHIATPAPSPISTRDPAPVTTSRSHTPVPEPAEMIKYLGQYDTLASFDAASTNHGEREFKLAALLPQRQSVVGGGKIMSTGSMSMVSGKYDLLIKCTIFHDVEPEEDGGTEEQHAEKLDQHETVFSYPNFAEVPFDAKWLDSEEFCDVTFTFPDGEQLRANRSVLLSRSPYFAQLVNRTATTELPLESHHITISIPRLFTRSTIYTIVYYLYTFDLPPTPSTFADLSTTYIECPPLLALSHIVALRRLLLDRILATYPPSMQDWHTQLLFALRHGLRELETRVAAFVATRMDELDNTEEMIEVVQAFIGQGVGQDMREDEGEGEKNESEQENEGEESDDDVEDLGGLNGLTRWLCEVFGRDLSVEPGGLVEKEEEGQEGKPVVVRQGLRPRGLTASGTRKIIPTITHSSNGIQTDPVGTSKNAFRTHTGCPSRCDEII